MEYRSLGRTGMSVSRITLGTAELGLDYGFRGTDHFIRPEAQEAERIVRLAVELGINLIDTAPIYGDAEEIIGRALRGMRLRPHIASKVAIPEDALAARDWSSM